MNLLKRMSSFLIVLVAGYLFILAMMYIFQNRLLFMPSSKLFLTPEEAGLQADDLWIETDDSIELHGWYFTGDSYEYVVVLSHGNAGNISARIDIAKFLQQIGVSVVLYDYRGYGQSSGSPSEEGLYRDVEAVVHYLRSKKGYSEEQMIMYGRSLGGAVASYAATRFDVSGLVLDSAFKNLKAMVADLYPLVPSSLAKYKFPTEQYLQEVSGLPVLIMHSPDDNIVKFTHGERLFELAGQPKEFVRLRGGHNENFHASTDLVEKSWRNFLNELDRRKSLKAEGSEN